MTATYAGGPGTLVDGGFCTFVIDGLVLGVPVEHVQEVLRYQQMTVVPRAPEAVRGLINLRGQIVTAVDLRRRLDLPPLPAGSLPMNVIVRSRGEVVSLLVDDIGDVIEVTGLELEPAPATMPARVREVLTGVVSLPEHILLVVDADRAVDTSTAHDTTGGLP
ncbi:MAG TPA: chemotaxis protein CheW [Nocardioides sp.]